MKWRAKSTIQTVNHPQRGVANGMTMPETDVTMGAFVDIVGIELEMTDTESLAQCHQT